MLPELTSALISLVGIIISTTGSWLISRSSAAKEMKKFRMEWEREDVVSSDEQFAEMSSAVARYIQTANIEDWNNAVVKIANIRAKEHGVLGEKLDLLYKQTRENNMDRLENYLTDVINQKREYAREH